MTADLRVFDIFLTAGLRVFGIFICPRTCDFLADCVDEFVEFFKTADLSILAFLACVDFQVFDIFVLLRTCEFLAFFVPASFWYFCMTADLRLFGRFL